MFPSADISIVVTPNGKYGIKLLESAFRNFKKNLDILEYSKHEIYMHFACKMSVNAMVVRSLKIQKMRAL